MLKELRHNLTTVHTLSTLKHSACNMHHMLQHLVAHFCIFNHTTYYDFPIILRKTTTFRSINSWTHLHGSLPIVLITKQTTLIQSNTTQVYFNSIVKQVLYFYITYLCFNIIKTSDLKIYLLEFYLILILVSIRCVV